MEKREKRKNSFTVSFSYTDLVFAIIKVTIQKKRKNKKRQGNEKKLFCSYISFLFKKNLATLFEWTRRWCRSEKTTLIWAPSFISRLPYWNELVASVLQFQTISWFELQVQLVDCLIVVFLCRIWIWVGPSRPCDWSDFIADTDIWLVTSLVRLGCMTTM